VCRYPPHGPWTIVVEEGVHWEILRSPPLDTPAHDLYLSDCLDKLQPGDHVEVQWRRNKDFPYGNLHFNIFCSHMIALGNVSISDKVVHVQESQHAFKLPLSAMLCIHARQWRPHFCILFLFSPSRASSS